MAAANRPSTSSSSSTRCARGAGSPPGGSPTSRTEKRYNVGWRFISPEGPQRGQGAVAGVPGGPPGRAPCAARRRPGPPRPRQRRRRPPATPRWARRSTSSGAVRSCVGDTGGVRRRGARATAGLRPALAEHARRRVATTPTSAPRPSSRCRAPGRDVGTPILTFAPGQGEREGSFFGPVISKAPRGAEAVEAVGRRRDARHVRRRRAQAQPARQARLHLTRAFCAEVRREPADPRTADTRIGCAVSVSVMSGRRSAGGHRYPRSARFNETLREVIAEELVRIDDERLAFVTITSIDVDNELNRAIVYFDSLAGEDGDDADPRGARASTAGASSRRSTARSAPRRRRCSTSAPTT